MLLLVTIRYSILCSHLQQFFTSWKCWSGKSLTFAQFCFLMTVYQNATVMNIFGCSLLFQLITKLRSCILSWTVIFLLVEIVILMYIRSFNKFGIKVLWRLQFLEYLRTLCLKFQKARTKIEVVWVCPASCLSLAETASWADSGQLQFWSKPSEILNLSSCSL